MGMTKTPGPVRIGDREQSTKILKKFCSWTLFVFGVVRQTQPQSSPARPPKSYLHRASSRCHSPVGSPAPAPAPASVSCLPGCGNPPALNSPLLTDHLQLYHVRVNFPGIHQFFRCALLGDGSVFQHYHLICAAHCAHAVGDDKYRFIFNQPRQGGLYQCFIFHIKACRGLVQQNDGRVFKKRAGD